MLITACIPRLQCPLANLFKDSVRVAKSFPLKMDSDMLTIPVNALAWTLMFVPYKAIDDESISAEKT